MHVGADVLHGRKVLGMKKLWRRVLLLSVMFILAMSVHALADTTYSAKTVSMTNTNKAGWSSQFRISSQTNVSVGVNIYNNSSPNLGSVANDINQRLTYVLEEVNTHQQYYLTDITYSSLNYEVHMSAVPAGTYSFGVYYSGSYWFNLYFRVTGAGIDIPDSIEVAVGSWEKVAITQRNKSGGYMRISSTASSNTVVADKPDFDSTVTPNIIWIHGKSKGSTTITVWGDDGTYDTMLVNVVAAKTKPTLLYSDLTMIGGETVVNEVVNSGDKVTWSSNKESVATVNKKGKITAVGAGTAKIKATTTKNGTTYNLYCTVTVSLTEPVMRINITSINPAKKTVRGKITNLSGVSMKVYSGNSKLLDFPGFLNIRNLKLKNYKSYVIGSGKTKKLTFKIKGAKVTGTKFDFGVRFKFKLDGRVYYARCVVDPLLGQYIPKAELGTENWRYAYYTGFSV